MPKFSPVLTNLPLSHQGKTRDTYADLPGHPDKLLVVATDRLSTHNVVHESQIPGKGMILTALTVFWLHVFYGKGPGVDHHMVAFGRRIFDYLPKGEYPADLHLRGMIIKKLKMIPVEFILRAYLAGSLYDKFYSKGLPNPYGINLPPGLPLMYQFEDPVFTPTEKSENDDPVDSVATAVKYSLACRLINCVFAETRFHLNERGLELVDSKFELGIDKDGVVTLADEVETPDSSRFTSLDEITVGQNPTWYDKQVARDEAVRMWDGGAKVPLTFSPNVVNRVARTYGEIFFKITGEDLAPFQREFME